jgi:hypothetical protein
MLENRLRRARTLLPDVVALGATCDAYQPAEESYNNTRRCLEILLTYHYPVYHLHQVHSDSAGFGHTVPNSGRYLVRHRCYHYQSG